LDDRSPSDAREPGPLEIRAVAGSDADRLARFFARNRGTATSLQFSPFELTGARAREIAAATGGDHFFVATIDDEVVAMSMLRGFDEGYAIPSLGIVVDGAQQGRGIGRRLVAWTVERARAEGCATVRLSVYGDNAAALSLYRSLGFVERERRPVARGPATVDKLVMTLDLDAQPPRRAIPVGAPALVGREREYVLDCLDSTWISSSGTYVERFEREFARFCGADHAVACVNGTAAVHLALMALGLGPGDEVLVPALTFVASANPVRYCGARPVFVDSEPVTWNVDPRRLAAAITPRTRGIIAVHLYGHPADMDAIHEVAARHGLWVVEDAAQAHGASYRGRPVGSLGAVAAFSFYGNKILTTGEGGMVVTGDASLAQRARLLRGQGQEPGRPYWFPVLGYNYRLTNVAAAIGLAQLERADWHGQRRREIAAWYREELGGVEGLELSPEEPWATSAYWIFCAVLDEARFGPRDAAMRALADAGIETRPFFYPLHTLPIYADDHAGGSLPVAEDLGRRGINLPSSALLTRDDVAYVAGRLRSLAR
jgi:perosamine synthetase